MKISFIIATIICSLNSLTVVAATTYEVEEFNRATELSSSAVQQFKAKIMIEPLSILKPHPNWEIRYLNLQLPCFILKV